MNTKEYADTVRAGQQDYRGRLFVRRIKSRITNARKALNRELGVIGDPMRHSPGRLRLAEKRVGKWKAFIKHHEEVLR